MLIGVLSIWLVVLALLLKPVAFVCISNKLKNIHNLTALIF